MRKVTFVVLSALAVVTACTSEKPNTVAIELREWAVDTEPASAAPGKVTFEISNAGEDPHEFVLARTDLDSDDLPTDDQGAVPEDDIEILDEVEELEPGDDGKLIVELAAGSYVLFCNLIEEEESNGETITEAHYSEGMHTTFEIS